MDMKEREGERAEIQAGWECKADEVTSADAGGRRRREDAQ
jgi:hypothetical protein